MGRPCDDDEHLKGPFGAVIKQVNESWKIASTGTASRSRFRCPAGWIDECGECYQPCEYAGSDCRMEGQTCQAIVCSHAPHGTGCVRP